MWHHPAKRQNIFSVAVHLLVRWRVSFIHSFIHSTVGSSDSQGEQAGERAGGRAGERKEAERHSSPPIASSSLSFRLHSPLPARGHTLFLSLLREVQYERSAGRASRTDWPFPPMCLCLCGLCIAQPNASQVFKRQCTSVPPCPISQSRGWISRYSWLDLALVNFRRDITKSGAFKVGNGSRCFAFTLAQLLQN